MPVGKRLAPSIGTWEIGRAFDEGTVDFTSRVVEAPRSTTDPHVWHSPQRPTQRVDDQPHSVH